MLKKFNNNLHKTYDELGRVWAINLFKRYGLDLKNNPNKYGVDLLAYRENKLVGNVEVEVRDSWDGIFKFEDLNIPARKQKLLTNKLKSVLVAFNKNGSMCFICKDDVVLSSPLVEVKNKYVPKGEMFYKVKLSKIKLIIV
jgi:hypothetical protein